jgi:hypothetical protein
MRRIVPYFVLIGLLAAAPASAQQRPLVTEDPETIGSGLVLLEGGIDYGRDIFYPVSGLTGNLLRLPTMGASFGISSIAEIQIDGGVYNRLTVTDRQDAPLSSLVSFQGDQTSSVVDLVIGTKLRVLSETAGRPAVGLRFATKLPTASSESGLGPDTTDFFASFLIGKTVQSIRVVGNVGIGILADATQGDRQNDVLTYGLSLARAVRQGLEVVGEVNGRADMREGDPPPGTDSRGAFRLGARYTYNTVRVDGGVIIGMTSRDPSVGFTAGLTWVFRGFSVP